MNTVQCFTQGCEEPIVRIERYHVSRHYHTVAWDCLVNEDRWTCSEVDGAYDEGTHFHLFCAISVAHQDQCFFECANGDLISEACVKHGPLPMKDGVVDGLTPECDEDRCRSERDMITVRGKPYPEHVNHEVKRLGRELPPQLFRAVYPGSDHER